MPDIFLLGSGIRGALQFSVETLQAIDVCDVVFVLHDDISILDFVRARGPEVIDAAEYYPLNGLRRDAYKQIAEAVVTRALKGFKVGLLVHGHPFFLVSAAEITLEKARVAGLNVSVLPAISSFDALLCELQLDFGYSLQMFDSTTLLRSNISLNPTVPALIFQIATVLNDDITKGDISNQVLQPLQHHLLKFYPEDHVCELVHTGTTVIERNQRAKVTLSSMLTQSAVALWKRPTLFIPPMNSSNVS